MREMGGDGNCFFRSIADQLDGDESLHMDYREKAVQHIRDNEDLYKWFIQDDEPFEDYVDRMDTNGEWAGQLEMKAICEMLEYNIMVH